METNIILCGDALTTLRTLPDESVQCCVTSPPYWNLRDYGVAGQIGLEATPDEWCARLVEVFSEVRRVLRSDGTLWLNVGDAYANDLKWGGRSGGKNYTSTAGGYVGQRAKRTTGLKPKDLIGLPWMLAFALRADGWWLRSDVIWHKSNPMPESVRDRPSRAHEYIFLLSKSERYYYDAEIVRTPLQPKTFTTYGTRHHAQGNDALGKVKSDNWGRTVGERRPRLVDKLDKQRGHLRRHAGFNDRWDHMSRDEQMAGGANLRDVWTVATKPFSGAHFATFPPALIEPCILAGCPVGGIVLDPFFGAGTVGVVCRRHGRDYLGIELNESYCEMARARIAREIQPVLWTAGSEASA